MGALLTPSGSPLGRLLGTQTASAFVRLATVTEFGGLCISSPENQQGNVIAVATRAFDILENALIIAVAWGCCW
jgi:hypothetical protein